MPSSDRPTVFPQQPQESNGLSKGDEIFKCELLLYSDENY